MGAGGVVGADAGVGVGGGWGRDLSKVAKVVLVPVTGHMTLLRRTWWVSVLRR
jgi:hypothetical protein